MSTEPLDDVSLIRRVAEQDEEAFETLYRRYYRRLFRFLHRVMGRPETVVEVLNDTMMVVWEKAASFRGQARVSTWITGIAYRKAIKAHRRLDRDKGQIRPESDDEWERLPAAEPVHAGAAEKPVEAAQLRLQIRRLLADLSPAHRAVVELTYYQGCSYEEVAELTGCPVNTVKTRMFHARAKLRMLIGKRRIETEGDG